MKITYTNLQENDFGVLKTVRQFKIDFGKSDGDRQRLADIPSPGKGNIEGSVLSIAGQRTGHDQSVSNAARATTEVDRDRSNLTQSEIFSTRREYANIDPLSDRLIRKFVQAQILTDLNRDPCSISIRI
jgi:hypothetical protein